MYTSCRVSLSLLFLLLSFGVKCDFSFETMAAYSLRLLYCIFMARNKCFKLLLLPLYIDVVRFMHKFSHIEDIISRRVSLILGAQRSVQF